MWPESLSFSAPMLVSLVRVTSGQHSLLSLITVVDVISTKTCSWSDSLVSRSSHLNVTNIAVSEN